jgi:glycosyltransferase involved in cell wall biosynthesis
MKSNGQIVFLTPGFPKDESDTSCLPYLQNYVKYFSKLNPETNISVITFQYPFFKGVYLWNGISVYSAGGKRKKHFLRLKTWITVVIYFAEIYYRNRIDLVHSFWLTECPYVGQYLASLFDIKHVVSIMGQDSSGANLYFSRLHFPKMIIAACSDKAATRFEFNGGRKANAIIPWGLDVETFYRLKNNQMRTVDIVGVGSLSEVKNFEMFIDIIVELKKVFPALKSTIIGEGEQRNLLTEKISKLNLNDTITLMGLLPREKVIDFMFQSKIFLHTASYEGQGYVFVEALYAGLPLVCFDVGFLIDSDKIFICKDKSEMVDRTKHLLEVDNDNSSVLMSSIQKTVTSFSKLYEQSITL